MSENTAYSGVLIDVNEILKNHKIQEFIKYGNQT